MKKTLFFAIVMIAVFSFQNVQAQVKGGFKLGADFSKLKMEDSDGNTEYADEFKRVISPRIGFILEVPVNDYLFVQTGLFAAIKGWRVSEEESGEKVKLMQILGTVDFPVNFGYKYDMGGAKLFAMAGPVLSYNVYTTMLFKYGDEDWDNNNDIKIGTDDTDTFKPMNFGVNVEAGVEVSSFQFSVYYSQGLSNFSNVEGSKFQTNVFGVAAAVKFGRVD
jgi:hypothetical protein